MGKRVIVIGEGLGAFSAALRLARSCEVTLLEKSSRVGGELMWEAPHPRRPNDRPFRFDTNAGPLTMPFVLMDLFAAANEDVRNHLKIIRVDPTVRCHWPDGATFDLCADEEDFVRELLRFSSPADAEGFLRLLQRGRTAWQAIEPLILQPPREVIRSADGFYGGLSLLTLPLRAGVFKNYSRMVARFVKHPKLREVLHTYAEPARNHGARATLLALPWIDHYFGGWHIEGGMRHLAERLESIMRKLGLKIRTDAPVARMLTNGGAVSAVKLEDGTELPADAVVSDADGNTGADSAMSLMLGVDGTYPKLAYQNKLISDADGCVEICVPTRVDPALAPEGCDALIVASSSQRSADEVIQALEERWHLENLGSRILVTRTMRAATAGNVFGRNLRSLFTPPPIRSREIRGLYLVGSASQARAGHSFAAIAGKIASDLVMEDLNSVSR